MNNSKRPGNYFQSVNEWTYWPWRLRTRPPADPRVDLTLTGTGYWTVTHTHTNEILALLKNMNGKVVVLQINNDLNKHYDK